MRQATQQHNLHVLPPKVTKERSRNTYLGGTDAAGVLGLSRYKTPLSVWAEKTGQVIPEDISDKLYVKLGTKLESIISDLFMEETGKRLCRVNETIFHPNHPFLGANIDRRVVGEDAGFEAKTCSAWKSKEWESEEIPAEYIFQVLHYLMVTGRRRWYLAVLIGNQEFKWKVIERDERLLHDLLKREVNFWNDYVVPRVMPKTMTQYDDDTLLKLYPQAQEGKEIILGDDVNQMVETLQGLNADKKQIEGLIDKTENQLKAQLGDADQGSTGLNLVKWINSKTSRLDSVLLKKELPDLYEKYVVAKPTRRFSYKRITEKKLENKEAA